MKIRTFIPGKLPAILFAALFLACGAGGDRTDPGVNNHSASGLISASDSSGSNGYGSITGVVGTSLLHLASCSDDKSVYIFEGNKIVPDDVDGIKADPVASAPVEFNPSSETYRYRITSLRAGAYTLAFTCQAREDDPETDDDISFLTSGNVTVLADKEISKHLF